MPLTGLWNEDGPVKALRTGFVAEAGIIPLLEAGSTFVVANAGPSLRWVAARDRFRFWKAEVKRRLIPAGTERFSPEEFPGSYCHVASEWRLATGTSVVLLETHH